MARIRTIKPELPEDEALGACSRDARLLFVLLITQADDHGRLRASPVLLRSKLFPYDDDVNAGSVDNWLAELAAAGVVERYDADGQAYAWIVNWSKHQRVDNAGKPHHPAPPSQAFESSPRDYASHGDLPLDQGPRKGPRTKDHDPAPAANPSDAQAVDNQEWWEEVWTHYADRAFLNERNVKNAVAWKRTVAKKAASEQRDRAETLIAQFELSSYQLGCVLAGDQGILRTAERRAS